MTVIYGLLCLDLLVIIHEFGHFFVAKWCGIEVESFSVGMGPIILHKKMKGTDWRLSLIPLGGYCGLKGQSDFQLALNEKAKEVKGEPGSFYALHPFKRILIAFAGPFANFLFAVIAYTIINIVGYSYYTTGNKIILANEIYESTSIPTVAADAGLKTGDKIVAINGKPTPYFSDIYEKIAVNAQKKLVLTVERAESDEHGDSAKNDSATIGDSAKNDSAKNDRAKNDSATEKTTRFEVEIVPQLNKETGGGVIGILSWSDAIIDEVKENTPAQKAKLEIGDKIIFVDDIPVQNTAEYRKVAGDKKDFTLTVEKADGSIFTTEKIEPETAENGSKLIGIVFHADKVEKKRYHFFPALFHGFADCTSNIALTFKGIAMLFKGIDITKAVSGPLRITVMLGDSAKEGFSAGFRAGLTNLLQFMSVISISLFIMNLLPIPILDGGLILFALIEMIIRKQVSPKIQYYVQFVGIAILLLLFAVALFGDVSYLIDKFKK